MKHQENSIFAQSTSNKKIQSGCRISGENLNIFDLVLFSFQIHFKEAIKHFFYHISNLGHLKDIFLDQNAQIRRFTPSPKI